MSDHTTVYIERHPGDLITADDWNALQRQIRDDIHATASEAADGVTHVASADEASQLDGKDLDALTDEITTRVLEADHTESGYRKIFRILEEGESEFDVIEHGLGNCPLVDVYKLQYFEVVCAQDDDAFRTITTFYLHHSSEKRLRVDDDSGNRVTVDIQPEGFPSLGIPFADMLARYDLETEFWKAFFSEPNDQFDAGQFCHSPWFERCCREERDVASLKSKGDWDDLVFQVRPWKIVSGPVIQPQDGETEFEAIAGPVPSNVGVAHLDLNRLAVWLNGPAIHGGDGEEARGGDGRLTGEITLPDEYTDELKVMLLLRV